MVLCDISLSCVTFECLVRLFMVLCDFSVSCVTFHCLVSLFSVRLQSFYIISVLIIAGIFGGIFTAVSGSGLDICSFSILTLLFRVTEKTATPTSVILMAGNTVVGFFWRVVSVTAL